ncbi:MAG: ATP-binding protein [Microcystaceae cyanobacterium]
MNKDAYQPFHLQVPTQIEALNEVLNWFETHISPIVPQRCGWEVKLALSEGFTNIVHYAHQHLPSTTPISLEIRVLQQQLEIKIWDFGDPFDFTAKLNVLKNLQQDPLEKEHERGLFLMNTIMDELQYVRVEDRNCLVMRKEF